MTYDVETRGTRRTVDVRRLGHEWAVTIDGRTIVVSVSSTGDRWSVLIADGPPEGGPQRTEEYPGPHGTEYGGAAFRRPMKSYEVSFGSRVNGERLVHVNGTAVPVSLLDPRERLARAAGTAHVGAGPRSIVAPMPGRVVKVLVKAGQHVEAHQGLVVVEAMKMENELRAPRAGTVAEVRVKDGMSVEAKAVLIVLES